VGGAIDISRRLGVSETIIGLTVVAVGTSLPELITSVIAAVRGQTEVALGNIIGSNIYNVLGILGVTAILSPISVPSELLHVDIWVLVAATVLIALLLVGGTKIGRAKGGVLLGGYIMYLAWLVHVA